MDPELALALRVSMEEERARQEEAAKKAAEEGSQPEKTGEQASTSQDVTMAGTAAPSASETENKAVDLMVQFLLPVLVFILLRDSGAQDLSMTVC